MTRPGWSELWWCDLGDAGRRPVLVLTRPEAVERLPRLLVALATTRVRNLPSEVHLDIDDGVPKPCVLNLDTPELVNRHQLDEFIGRLSALRWHEVCQAVGAAVNC
ncbi:MAG TPA: type II toxin-antitoxin system PemK/MazF family toxin [Ilumatobacter sp.]|nr:type II toxin-antitoxin system PemK/MazF family toxin [Ilumatobacter sp.]